jgi:hypothetical protein
MGFIQSNLENGEEIIYQVTPPHHVLYLVLVVFEGVLLVLLANAVPVCFALGTHRFGYFPVTWGLPDSLPVLIISIGLWLIPLLTLLGFSAIVARIFACELAVTNLRILGRIPSKWIFQTVNLPFDVVSRVEIKGNRIYFSLRNGKKVIASGFQNAGVMAEVCRVRMMIATGLTPLPTLGDDPTRRLKRLKEALDSGLITESEYNQKKNQILQQM